MSGAVATLWLQIKTIGEEGPMASVILAVLTGALVAVTAYYAWQTKPGARSRA
jgi:hypothetical protein